METQNSCSNIVIWNLSQRPFHHLFCYCGCCCNGFPWCSSSPSSYPGHQVGQLSQATPASAFFPGRTKNEYHVKPCGQSMDKSNVVLIMCLHSRFDPYLPKGSKSGAKSCVCAGAILDPCGKFRECGRSGVTPVAQHDGWIITTVTDSSSFVQKKSHTDENQSLPYKSIFSIVKEHHTYLLWWTLEPYLWTDWRLSCRDFLSVLGQGSSLHCEAKTKHLTVRTTSQSFSGLVGHGGENEHVRFSPGVCPDRPSFPAAPGIWCWDTAFPPSPHTWCEYTS